MTKKENSSNESSESKLDTPSVNVSGQEYRLVPVGEWGRGYSQNLYNPDDEIDLIELLKTLWDERKLILSFTIAGLLLGALFVWMSTKEYEVNASLLQEYNAQEQSQTNSLLRQFGGLAGINTSQPISTSTIPVTLYPEIIKTYEFQKKLMEQPFYIPEVDSQATLITYFTDIREPNGVDVIKSWTIGLPGKILRVISSLLSDNQTVEINNESSFLSTNILKLSPAESRVSGELSSRIQVTTAEGGIINVSVKFPDPVLAANVAEFFISNLTDYLIEYRTGKIRRDLEFLEQQTNESKARYEEALLKLSEFRESVQGSAAARTRQGEQFLESEFSMASGIYSSFNQQLEQQKLKLQEETPFFSYLNPIKIPTTHSEPKGSLIILITGILAGFLSLLFVFIKKSSIREAFNS